MLFYVLWEFDFEISFCKYFGDKYWMKYLKLFLDFREYFSGYGIKELVFVVVNYVVVFWFFCYLFIDRFFVFFFY